MNLAKLKQIAPQLDADLAVVFAKYGLKVTHRLGQVDEVLGTLKYNLTLVEADAATSPEAIRWGQYASLYQLPVDALNKTFTLKGKQYKVIGLRTGRSLKCVVAEHNGKTFVFTPEVIKKLLARA